MAKPSPSARQFQIKATPMETIANNAEFFAAFKGLIDSWCDRRALKPLARVLGPYLAFNGLTDGWGEILNGLKAVRALRDDDISEAEMDTVRELIHAAERAVSRSSTSS